ncbi:polysaccharide biosynthesis protein [Methylorubrum extorquens CM4]|uniref:Polysaccharide biosynthesis protein n=2 Tax=Methylorubrum extorquens TaxID=408 RepID=B7L195_METC4|nr:polysaccharide biosynthesis protein [Methylorubrum extorquens CM4]
MAVSLAVKMFAGLIFFIIVARLLSEEQLGFVTFVFACSAFGALLSDLGLGMKILKDVSAEPERARLIVLEALYLKFLALLPAMLVLCVLFIMKDINQAYRLSAISLVVGTLIGSVGDTALFALRAANRYAAEAVTVLLCSIVYLLLTLIAGLAEGGIVGISLSFLASRMLYAAVVLLIVRSSFPSTQGTTNKRSLWIGFRRAFGWAALSNLSYINGQIDNIMIVSLVGLAENGVYQAGAKFVASAVSFSSIIVNVGIPKISALKKEDAHKLKAETGLWLQTVGVGAIFASLFFLFGPVITKYLVGAKYESVNSLWTGFAVLTFARFVSCALLISLLGRGLVYRNFVAELATTAFALPLLALSLPIFGIYAAPWVMSFASFVTCIVLITYRIVLARAPSGL